MRRADSPGFSTLAALPWLFVLVSVASIFLLWANHRRHESQELHNEARITADHVRLRLESWVDARIAVVRHMASTVDRSRSPHNGRFRRDAVHFIELFPGFLAINHVDADGVIDIVVPEAPNRKASKRSLFNHPEPDVQESFRRAGKTGALTRTSVIDLFQGGLGLATYAPVTSIYDGSTTGYVNGVFRVEQLVEACLSEASLRDRFTFSLSEVDGRVAYTHPEGTTPECMDHCAHATVRIVDRPWHLHLSPVEAGGSPLAAADFLAGGGAVMALLMGLLMRAVIGRQRELAESREIYRLMIENQTDLVLKVDADMTVIIASPSFCRMFGVAESEVLGHDLLSLMRRRDRDGVRRDLETALRPPFTSAHEHRIDTAGGPRWLSWIGSAILDERDEPTGLVIVGRDISQRRELEDRLTQSQKMQAVGQLAGGIAHDFNNILQSISGSLELAMMDTEEGIQPYRDMEQARSSADRAAALTRQLLAFSRRQVLEPAVIDLNDVVAEMIELLRQAVGRHVDLDFMPSPVPAVVNADATQVQQVLLNLCVNARDAVDEHGRVRVVLSEQTISEAESRVRRDTRPGSFIMLEVADDGCGIAPNDMEMIFEPFYTTRKAQGGTGLGLSTVYGIVTQHGGWIEVASSPGRGTSFRIYIERSEAESRTSHTVELADPVGGDETILLAEDEDGVRNFTVRTLEAAGYRVLPAADGEDALSIYEKRCDGIDMAVLDVVMPNLGGREVHDHIRAHDPDLPILFCSGYDSETIHTRFILDEGLQLLPKPFDSEQLLRRVRTLLDAAAVRAD